MNILLPIETINREIDFKIVLAGFLSNQGHKVYIGQHEFLMKLVPKIPHGGLYIGKNIFNKRSDLEKGEKYHLLKKYNFDVIYLHEEGAVFPGKEADWIRILKSQYNTDFFDENDKICVWGDFQKRIDEARRPKSSVITTGHPRFDLCKEKWHSLYFSKVEILKKAYGNFVLINGNYGMANHGLGLEHVFSEKGDYNVADETQRLKRVNFFCHSSKKMIDLVCLTHELAVKFPKLNFVFRPHPSENHQYYKTVFVGVNNIFVSHDGPILPWIIASKAIIHDGCTTAIEATLANKLVINFETHVNQDYDVWLPNQMGVKANGINEVVSYLNNMEANENAPVRQLESQLANQLLYNFNEDSFESLLKVINELITEKEQHTQNKNISSAFIQKVYFTEMLKTKLYLMLKPHKRKNIEYHKTKFYGFNEGELAEKIKMVSAILGKKINHKFHNSKLIEIE
ncbi:hypothetical protein EZL74_10945 [Flavobacterium silvisoli]|uniref:Surface carbohydrate biosynthesis protein n=1 Tax=Flavobacterium silvisoli TaxID=2529433 RepID=A0A4V2L4D4_9FLAO|nr:surface carbohydrate biosynthesis protein [Flavobacterium silvisoli]TBX66358.1 hypothetical protein EZL74_10945 [Flavobacterium silvisoli]